MIQLETSRHLLRAEPRTVLLENEATGAVLRCGDLYRHERLRLAAELRDIATELETRIYPVKDRETP